MNTSDYDEDELYGTSLAEDRKALAEDLEHLYFTAVGILIATISPNWQTAAIAAVLTVGCRDFIRWCDRRKKK